MNRCSRARPFGTATSSVRPLVPRLTRDKLSLVNTPGKEGSTLFGYMR